MIRNLISVMAVRTSYRKLIHKVSCCNLINESILNLTSTTHGKKGSCHNISTSSTRRIWLISKMAEKQLSEEMKLFDEVFDHLVADIMSIYSHKSDEIGEAMNHFKEVVLYNVPHGKKNRGLTVVTSYQYLVGEDNLTDENLRRARILGWCVELLQAYFLVADDMMDESLTRRGKPCWYKKDGIGMVAINDSFFLDSCIYSLLKKYFRNEPYYVDIMELFHETSLQTMIGQSLDLLTSPSGHKVDFTRFSTNRYSAIVKWKTAFYSFYLPVALSMYMAGIKDADSHEKAKDILLKMGHFFQVQDDYLDCYGDPLVTGKIGTDIEDNKCSWLINEALTRASPEQKQVLQENYAQRDPECVAKVKSIFNELDLSGVYHHYEEDSYQELMKLIDSSTSKLPKELFRTFAQKIYKRKK